MRRPAHSPGALPTRVSARRFDILTRLRKAAADRLVARRNRRAEAVLRADTGLWDLIAGYGAATAVTGAAFSDYLTLYEQVRRYKPVEILECGTGISTLVLAHALRVNRREGGAAGRVTSMEDDAGWYAAARTHIPDALSPMIDLVHSPKVDGYYRLFRGVQYAHIPDRPYDFVFSDGPDRHSPVNGDKLFNLDLIQVVRRSPTPVRAVVDNHYLTFYILQKVFGPGLARYSVGHKLMFVGPVTRADVRRLKKENFLPDLRLLRPTVLHLRLSREGGGSGPADRQGPAGSGVDGPGVDGSGVDGPGVDGSGVDGAPPGQNRGGTG